LAGLHVNRGFPGDVPRMATRLARSISLQVLLGAPATTPFLSQGLCPLGGALVTWIFQPRSWMISWPSMNGCIHSAFLLARPQHCRLLHNSAAPVEKETVVRQSQPRYLASTLWYFSPLANDDGICRTRAILRRRPDRLARHPTWSGGTYKCPSIFISFVCFSPSWHYVTALSNDYRHSTMKTASYKAPQIASLKYW
jgi:hypothetical protein